ncbi:MAG: MipA/OmpV family protein [Desulfobacterales bacterium]|nr:MAG: MipA/OmpV family protein [Desulfobacterales bacterium]
MKTRKILVALLLAGALGITLFNAAHVQAEVESFSLGAGVGAVPDYEGSEDYEIVPIPFASVVWDSGRYLELQGLKLRANLLTDKFFRLGPMANYRPSRSDVDDDKVDALKNVDAALELGAFAGFEINNWNASLEFLQDVGNGHEGFLLTLKGGYLWPVGDKWSLSLGVSTTYASGEYMSSYFGIDSRDAARSGLKTFDADPGIKDVGLMLGVGYRFSEKWSVRAVSKYTRLLDDAADSPVVDDQGDENQYFAGALVVYTFGKVRAKRSDVEPYHF